MSKVHVIDGVQYREVDRNAITGDLILVTSCRGDEDYKVGDKLRVADADGTGHVEDLDGSAFGIYRKEYVVLEKISEDADIIVHEGVQYRKVDRAVREGDRYVVAKEDELDVTAGKVYAITHIDSDGDPEFKDDADDTNGFFPDGYYVLEPLAPDQSALESALAEVKAKVAELERKLAEKVAQQKAGESERLKVGDYAISPTGNNVNDHAGEVVEIVVDDESLTPFQAKLLNGEYAGWFYERDLRIATDEEVAEAKRKLAEKEETEKWAAIGRKVGEFKVGDVARIVRYQIGLAEGTVFVIEGFKRERTVITPGGYGADTNCIELVAPVESIVNLRAGANE